MRNLQLVLQNAGGGTGRSATFGELSASALQRRMQPELTPQETDALLSESMWSRRLRRVLTEFQDNYSGDFRLFRIY